MRTISFILAMFMAQPAMAQLPQVQLPPVALPGVQLPGVPAAGRVGGSLRDLAGARALRADRLLREHRAELDRDPRGDLVVRAEVVAIDITDVAFDRALEEKFVALRTQELADIGVKITVLQTPQGWSATRGLKRLRKLDPEGTYDFNHVYLDAGAGGTPAVAGDIGTVGADAHGRVGLIDTGVDDQHQAFEGVYVSHFGCHGTDVPDPHGTAVAALILSRHAVREIFAADVYCNEPTGGSIENIAAALGWMARERVAVINVSLVGPRNALLERVVKTLVNRGHLIVAAVGNDGPASPPLFPAAYYGVVGVTAVDAKQRVLLEACRGSHVDFAALGDLEAVAAKSPDVYVTARGTSFASPLVAGLLSRVLSEPDPDTRARAVAALTEQAVDLGPNGRDNIYGAGLVAADSALKQ